MYKVDRQTDRQTDRQVDRQVDRRTDEHTWQRSGTRFSAQGDDGNRGAGGLAGRKGVPYLR